MAPSIHVYHTCGVWFEFFRVVEQVNDECVVVVYGGREEGLTDSVRYFNYEP